MLPALTLANPTIRKNQIKTKASINFSFHNSLSYLKFYEGWKTFIKPNEAPQSAEKIVNFC